MPSPEFVQLLAAIRARPAPPPGLPLDILRMGFEALMSVTPVPADVTCEELTCAGRPAQRLSPPGVEKGRVLLYLHGGAYVIGNIRSHRELAARIGRGARAEVVIVDYRLAPEHPFPAGLDDTVASYKWLLDQGSSPSSVALVGDSAGGGLAMATAVTLRDAGTPLPGAIACLSPWVDLALTGESFETKAAADPILDRETLLPFVRHYLGDTDTKHPLASPLYANLTGLPPLLVQVGTAETLLDDALALAERARVAGVKVTLDPWEDMTHVFQVYAGIPEAESAVRRLGAFLRENTQSVTL